MNIELRVRVLCRALQHNYYSLHNYRNYSIQLDNDFSYKLEKGYHKIIRRYFKKNVEVIECHCLIDVYSGDVYAAKTWSKPMDIPLYNILEQKSWENLLTQCDWRGNYLDLK